MNIVKGCCTHDGRIVIDIDALTMDTDAAWFMFLEALMEEVISA